MSGAAKITELPSLATPALADLVAVVDDPSGTPVTKSSEVRAVVAAGVSSGHLYDSYTAGGTAIGSIGTSYVQIATFDGDHSSGDITAANATDNITLGASSPTGVYSVRGQFSFSGTANATFIIGAAVGGTVDNGCVAVRKLGTGGDVGNCGFDGALSLTASDVVTVWIKALAGTNSITMQAAQLSVSLS